MLHSWLFYCASVLCCMDIHPLRNNLRWAMISQTYRDDFGLNLNPCSNSQCLFHGKPIDYSMAATAKIQF